MIWNGNTPVLLGRRSCCLSWLVQPARRKLPRQLQLPQSLLSSSSLSRGWSSKKHTSCLSTYTIPTTSSTFACYRRPLNLGNLLSYRHLTIANGSPVSSYWIRQPAGPMREFERARERDRERERATDDVSTSADTSSR
jgi:hypothetical protein